MAKTTKSSYHFTFSPRRDVPLTVTTEHAEHADVTQAWQNGNEGALFLLCAKYGVLNVQRKIRAVIAEGVKNNDATSIVDQAVINQQWQQCEIDTWLMWQNRSKLRLFHLHPRDIAERAWAVIQTSTIREHSAPESSSDFIRKNASYAHMRPFFATAEPSEFVNLVSLSTLFLNHEKLPLTGDTVTTVTTLFEGIKDATNQTNILHFIDMRKDLSKTETEEHTIQFIIDALLLHSLFTN